MDDQNEESTSVDEDVRKAKQGKVTGVIIPPPDIRAVVDKTAQFVARNGKSFEQRILSSGEGKTAKFNFMKQFDPYHAYYEQKIREFEEGKNGEAAAEPAAIAGVPSEETKQAEAAPVPAAVSVSTSAKASITTPIARFAMNKPNTEPPPFEFTVEHPSGLNALDVDIIKLTAQYTVANGKDFLLGLAVREQRNPQFDFLKPTHMLFSYFTTLVDAYAKVLQPSTEQMERVKAKKDRMKSLESAVHRWEWMRSEEERKKKDAVHKDEERSAFQSIDWFDFTVVETIDFGEDELYEQPNQKPLARVEEDEDMEMDEEEDDHMRAAATQRMDMPPPPPFQGNRAPTSSSSSQYGAVAMQVNMEPEGAESAMYGGYEGEMEMETETEVDLNVVSDYAPRMAGSGQSSGPMTMIDPISGKVIPVDEMSEHMRVQLMDPRWRIEQKRFQEKQRETGYAEGGSIADSLKQFARKRGDIFGQNDGRVIQEEKSESVQWDGHMASIPQMQQLKNEIAARAPQLVVTAASVLPAIGPTIPGLGPQAPRIVVPLVISQPAPPSAPMPVVSSINYPIANIPIMQMNLPVHVSIPIPPPPATRPSAPYPPAEPEGPAGKRPRVDAAPQIVLVPAEEFAAQYPGPVTLSIVTPIDPSVPVWGLGGQSVPVTLGVMSTVKQLKDALTAVLGGMPVGKQQLKSVLGGAFFKDTQTLAALNLGEGAGVELTVKTRGGAKK